MTDKPRILLVDLSSLFWTYWHVHHENGSQMARTQTLEGVRRANGEGRDVVVICCDSKTNFRKQISAEYKAQREAQPAAAYGELERTKERLASDGYLIWEFDGFEADDVIASACKAARDRGHEVRIASSDKDLMQLLGPGVDIIRTHHNWEVWDSRMVVDKIRVDPNQLCDYLSLTGDPSDNIPGADGIGKVRAAELLTRYETLDRIYEALDAGKEVATQSIEKSLRENRAKVELSRKLVALRFDVPIVFDDLFKERKVLPLTENRPYPGDGDLDDGSNANAVSEQAAIPSSAELATTTDAESPKQSAVALAPVVVEYEKQLEPRGLAAAFWLGEKLATSRMYSKYPNAEAITAVIIRGRELGLGALTALDSFHFMDGRPVPHAYLMIARAKEHPDCEYLSCDMETSTDKSCTWRTKSRRNPKEQVFTYTIEMARAAGLVQPAQEKTGRDGKKYWSKDNQWVVRPAEMLRKTCGVQLARAEYPSATMGLYAWEELGGNSDD